MFWEIPESLFTPRGLNKRIDATHRSVCLSVIYVVASQVSLALGVDKGTVLYNTF